MCELKDFEFTPTNIKGKEYVEVNQRIKAFRTCDAYKDFSMESEIVKFDDASILMKAIIKDPVGRVVATGLAYEEKDSSLINKTSFVENCETSAWGRALACLGIGIIGAVSSKEEVQGAIERQEKISNSEGSRTIVENNTKQPEPAKRSFQQVEVVDGVRYLFKRNKEHIPFLVIEDQTLISKEHPKYYNSNQMLEMGLIGE